MYLPCGGNLVLRDCYFAGKVEPSQKEMAKFGRVQIRDKVR